VLVGEIDATGQRERALDAFLATKTEEGFALETRTATHAIIVEPRSFFARLRGRAPKRYVVSVDEHGGLTTMTPAEPKRS